MITGLNYQTIVDMVGQMMTYAIPIGLVFGITEKLVTMFFSFAFGKENIKL